MLLHLSLDYRDTSGKRIRKDIGWASEGFTAALAAQVRAKLINEAKTAAALGIVPEPIKMVPTLQEAWEFYKRDWLGQHIHC
jgi:hypothetical protein